MDRVFECQDYVFRYEVMPIYQDDLIVGHMASQWMKPDVFKPLNKAEFREEKRGKDSLGEEAVFGTEEQAVSWCIEKRIRHRQPEAEAKARGKQA